MLKRYKRSMLTDDQVKWIVKQKVEGKMKNEDIAAVQGISVRRVQQIYAMYKKNSSVPVLKKAGRHKVSITEDERKVIIEVYGQFKSCASYLERFIMHRYGLKVSHTYEKSRCNVLLPTAPNKRLLANLGQFLPSFLGKNGMQSMAYARKDLRWLAVG